MEGNTQTHTDSPTIPSPQTQEYIRKAKSRVKNLPTTFPTEITHQVRTVSCLSSNPPLAYTAFKALMDKHLAGDRIKALWGPQLSQSVNLPEGQLWPSHLAAIFATSQV